jgi:hypothetical protein
LLQTIYLDQDAECVSIEPVSGRIGIAYGRKVIILDPLIRFDKPPLVSGDRNIENQEIS